MTKEQGRQLGHALVAWSDGFPLEARDIHGRWWPFFPENYEKITVDENLEWRIATSFPPLPADIFAQTSWAASKSDDPGESCTSPTNC